ncbi:TlpA family protein disulfide reductase [Chondromyces apiculatus]|uniref:Redoxin domain protein n=1 Tax=Chondromyces apiculatus DSM 436 TaxID=1192034 RepID=A0A017TAL1_9BACT|nr:TlpA disulfide reductase family protein [Chondromyces apiculatus]EYF05947.1 Redoxin domain protein [Chondromyces apiculatus DSM 436]
MSSSTMHRQDDGSGKFLYPAIAAILAVSALFGMAVLPHLAPGGHSMVGKPGPDLTLPVAANGDPGARMQLRDLQGQAVILDFWASWCGPCGIQAPILERIARRYENKGLVVLGINVDDPSAVARQYAAHKGLSYPILLDEARDASAQYDVDKLPTLVVLDKEGKVAAYLTAIVDEASLDAIIAQVL